MNQDDADDIQRAILGGYYLPDLPDADERENELINHPSYYQGCAQSTRPIVLMLGMLESWLDEECILAIENNHFVHTSFHMGEVITHLWRYGRKEGEALKDLRKAEWYLQRINERYPNNLKYFIPKQAIEMIRALISEDFPDA
jgi:Protein of unknwon function (DUF3310)